MVMCTVPSSDRRRRFVQYNFMDPGWGGGQNFLRGGQAPLVSPRWRRVQCDALYHNYCIWKPECQWLNIWVNFPSFKFKFKRANVGKAMYDTEHWTIE